MSTESRRVPSRGASVLNPNLPIPVSTMACHLSLRLFEPALNIRADEVELMESESDDSTSTCCVSTSCRCTEARAAASMPSNLYGLAVSFSSASSTAEEKLESVASWATTFCCVCNICRNSLAKLSPDVAFNVADLLFIDEPGTGDFLLVCGNSVVVVECVASVPAVLALSNIFSFSGCPEKVLENSSFVACETLSTSRRCISRGLDIHTLSASATSGPEIMHSIW
mmetsp:Transcript_3148/g.4667  ORF Transcript_3148/g.4667 Transcript_3148/m.4667 type:complete len:226 (+) Transcript_3148:1143-1820(+)